MWPRLPHRSLASGILSRFSVGSLQSSHQSMVMGSRNPVSLQRLTFHTSRALEFPVRRRRRPIQRTEASPASGEEDDGSGKAKGSPLAHNQVDDDVEFVQGANALLDKLEKALEPMKRQNEIFEIERFFGDMGEVLTIDLGPKEGKYRIEMSLEDGR